MPFEPRLDFDPELKFDTAKRFLRFHRAQRAFWKSQYLEFLDLTGYKFAEQYVEGGYAAWREFFGTKDFAEEVGAWQDELEVKLQSIGVRGIAQIALSGEKGASDALKWLASKGWMPKEDKRTKDARKKAEKVEAEVQEDMARVLKLVPKTA